jgi:hypothetical protein
MARKPCVEFVEAFFTSWPEVIIPKGSVELGARLRAVLGRIRKRSLKTEPHGSGSSLSEADLSKNHHPLPGPWHL